MNLDSKKIIRWLHLSDFHLKNSGKWSQDVVLRSLLKDISERYAGPDSLDFIFITGDLAWSGQAEEYLLVEEFIRDLLSVTELSSRRLMMVPGNHDIDREMEIDAFVGARSALQSPDDLDKFFGHEGRRRTLFRRQAAFRKFANNVCDRRIYTKSSYCHTIKHSVNGLSIAVLLIDSSWLSAGGRGDAHVIVVGERQLIDSASLIPESTLTIGLMHHPEDWLAPYERSSIKNLLSENCHLLFRGHVHEDSVEIVSRSQSHLNIFTAGAAYETRTSRNCYGYGFVDMLSGHGECVIHKYRNESKSWDKQESIAWNLIDQAYVVLTLGTSHDFVSTQTAPYPNYLVCLIAQKAMEIPLCDGGQVQFISLTDSEARSSLFGKCILKMRHVLYWRQIWDESEWDAEMAQLIDSYCELIRGFEEQQETKDILVDRNERFKGIIQLVSSGDAVAIESGNAIHQARQLAEKGSMEASLGILQRLIAQNDASTDELLSAHRLVTKVYLETKEYDRALESGNEVLSSEQANGNDYLVAAVCCFNLGDFDGATTNIYTANELGAPIPELKRLATLVAGQTGDSELLQKIGERK